ncbi:tyrosine-protein phosphatase non-receptor type substrate 1-like [Rhincodon typus]|uniref:tyrosine-protein phosphatase non-receptor type substrate 1-like n=1 Tax=Rhincodon typus TaxID=259920 RepID=UPI00202E8EA7|nr:tyrosine-protein phosphatase non-receptor type substrate 1-like [Rhincodon typus]
MIILQCMLVLEMISTAFCYSHIQVSQKPQRIIRNFGENVTITCAFSIPSDDSEVGVFWWKLGDNALLHPSADARKRYFKRKGQGTLLLIDIRLEDAGVYYCGVNQNRAMISNGTGTTLVVYNPPSTPTILSKTPDGNSDIYLHLVCETVDFYPAAITFNWYKNTSKIVTGIKTTQYLTDAGLHRASSTLQESQPIQKGTSYICLVSHSATQSSKLSVYLVSSSTSGIDVNFDILAIGCAVSGLVCLVLGAVIGKRCKSRSCRGTNQDAPRPCEEMTLEVTEDSNLGYAALNMFSSEKGRTHRQQENCTHYAAIKTGMDAVRNSSTEI